MFVTELVCDSCGASYPCDQPILLCRQCGGLLDAQYDYAAIKRVVRLENIAQRQPRVWRWFEFLPLSDKRYWVDIGAGGSPLIECPRLAEWVGAAHLYVKYDGVQPTASLKDRSFAIAVSKAIELNVRGAITYSSGNAAASLAAHACYADLKGLVLVNAWADPAKIAMLRCYGLPIILLHWSHFAEVEALLTYAINELFLYSFVNFQNPWRHEGNKTYAFEIWWDLGQRVPDHEIHPVGTGGGIFGAWKGYRELIAVGLTDHLPQLHGTQPAACQSLVTAFDKRLLVATAEGDPHATIAEAIATDLPLGGGRRPLRAIYESGGLALAITDQEMLDGIRRLGQEGISAEPAGATTIWAAKHLAEMGVIKKDQTVVCVVTASGLKQPQTLLTTLYADELPHIDAIPQDLKRLLPKYQI